MGAQAPMAPMLPMPLSLNEQFQLLFWRFQYFSVKVQAQFNKKYVILSRDNSSGVLTLDNMLHIYSIVLLDYNLWSTISN